jgi:hypothetical protein
MDAEVEQLLSRWSEAEGRGDANLLGALLDDDFVGIGPVGFVLDRDAWLDRFDGGLHYDDLGLDEVAVHHHGPTVIAVARQHAEGRAGDVPVPSETRVSFTMVELGAGPRIAAIQYSFMGPPLRGPQ